MRQSFDANEMDHQMASPSSISPEEMLDRERFDIANRLYFRLYQSSNLLHKVGTRYVSEFSATTQQWAVLGALSRPAARNGMMIKDLLDFLLVSRQNLTPLLDRLEDRGWIERVKDPADGRNRRIQLTPVGRDVWSKMLTAINDFYSASTHCPPSAPMAQI